MMMKRIRTAPYKNSIEHVGLKAHLNATRGEHNNFGYDDFVRIVEDSKGGRPSKASMASIFNVSRHSMTKWLDIYNKEQAK